MAGNWLWVTNDTRISIKRKSTNSFLVLVKNNEVCFVMQYTNYFDGKEPHIEDGIEYIPNTKLGLEAEKIFDKIYKHLRSLLMVDIDPFKIALKVQETNNIIESVKNLFGDK